MVGSSIFSIRTPQITPVIDERAGFIRGAFAKKSSNDVLEASSCSSVSWLCPVSQRIISSTSPFVRSEEHTSELQSLMRISYAGFCLKKQHLNKPLIDTTHHIPPQLSHTS